MSTTVTITERDLFPLQRLQSPSLRAEAAREIGRAVVKLVRGHLQELPPNKQGFPSTRFWQRAADATRYEVVPEGVRVSVNQTGVRQRLLGGEIKPVRGKYLTIPALAETYGHHSAEFGPLKMVFVNSEFGERGGLALVSKSLALRKNETLKPGSVFFWLARSVRQEPNPQVLPKPDEVLATARQAAAQVLK